ncbi:hypothetical protein ANTQUA_LOCUS5748 [Anthophora quadrimaculata]
MSWSGEKTNENERATKPTDDVASRGTEVYASSGPFYPGSKVYTKPACTALHWAQANSLPLRPGRREEKGWDGKRREMKRREGGVVNSMSRDVDRWWRRVYG